MKTLDDFRSTLDTVKQAANRIAPQLTSLREAVTTELAGVKKSVFLVGAVIVGLVLISLLRK